MIKRGNAAALFQMPAMVSTAVLQKPVPLRRRRSKGTIAGFASASSSGSSHNDLSSHEVHNDMPHVSTQSFGSDIASSSGDVGNQPQHSNDSPSSSGSPPVPPKPCHSARLALLCVQNATHMGARTQLNLCPPGKARDDLLKILQMRRRKKKSTPPPIRRTLSIGRSISTVGSRTEESPAFEKVMGESGINEYDEAEDEYLNNPVLHSIELNNDGEEMKEEETSGDEDPLDVGFDDEDGLNPHQLKDGENNLQQHREELFTLGTEISGAQGASISTNLAFNMRKIKWFDTVTASDCATARQYLRKEHANLRKKDISILTKHLKKIQKREKRKREIEAGRRNSMSSETYSDDEEDEELLQQSTQTFGLSKLPNKMTPSLSAALVLESLTINPLESLEGMSKCYEGIVAVGSALLDADIVDSALDENKKPSKSEIMSALAPLLITTLEQPSGETIFTLAKLRKLCGTKRYQRRFVQRIAPSLVRPPNAAMWCLRHRDDMESILAATEMILDAAFDIFSSGWYERGRTLLADSERAKTLKAAAMQLKRLSSNKPPDSLMKGLSTAPGTHHRRGNSRLIGITPAKVSSAGTSGTEVLAEWEVLAVDRQIRQSLDHLFTKDWSRVVLTNAPPRDGETYSNQRTRRGITGNKSKPSHAEPNQIDTVSVSSSEPILQDSPPRVGKPKSRIVTASDFMSGNAASPKPDDAIEPESRAPDPVSPRPTDKSFVNGFVRTPPRSPPQMDLGPVAPQSPTRKPNVTPPLQPPHPNGDYQSNNTAPLSPSGSRNGLNPSSSPSPSIHSTYLRTLTATAAERKRTVAACRALRAQIARFEDAFMHLHGRPPKGAADRAPLTSTYTQYREWKRAIRADAASRIQALFRGARCRWLLERNVDPRFKKIVMNQAGRPAKIKNLPLPAIPNNINDRGGPSVRNKPLSRRPENNDHYGVEVYYENGGSRPMPTWNVNRGSPNRSKGSRDDGSISSGSGFSGPQPIPSLHEMTYPELQTRKRELKQQLKQYDMSFFNQHRRMPVKAEKEPIRHLYENYNSLKIRITMYEREGPPINQIRPGPRHVPPQTNHAYAEVNGSMEETSLTYSKASVEKHGKWKAPLASSEKNDSVTPLPTATPTLATLRTEKQTLHQMLRSYEKDFFNLHNRQVSCYADIRPVASQYRRYKEIKKLIQALQDKADEKKKSGF